MAKFWEFQFIRRLEMEPWCPFFFFFKLSGVFDDWPSLASNDLVQILHFACGGIEA